MIELLVTLRQAIDIAHHRGGGVADLRHQLLEPPLHGLNADAELADLPVKTGHRWRCHREIPCRQQINMGNQPLERSDHPARHAKPDGDGDNQQQGWPQNKQILQIGQAGHQRLPALLCARIAGRTEAGKVIVEVGLESLGRDGKEGIDGLRAGQRIRLLFNRAVEKLVAVYQPLVFGWIKRPPRLPALLRRRQRLLGLVHQAMPAALGAGGLILHKIDTRAVKQIAGRQQGHPRFINPGLLQKRLLIESLMMLGVVEGAGEEKR